MRWCSLILVLAIVTAAGCGGSSYSAAPVSGRVTLDGQPVSGASVVFQPVAEKGKTANPGPGSVGATDADGKFTLELVGGNKPGAVVGKHRVTISPSGEGAGVSQKIPTKYRTGSALSFEVPQGGTDKADFPLSSK